jgi:competence protein ComEC
MGINEELKRVPILRLLLPFILGIVLQNIIGIPLSYLVPAFIFIFFLLCFFWKYDPLNRSYRIRWLYGLTLNLFFLLLSMSLMERKMQAPSFLDHSGMDGVVIARVLEYPLERERTFRTLVRPLILISGDSVVQLSGRALLWLEKDSCAGRLRAGDRVALPNGFSEITNSGNPFEFDQRRYMRLQGVFAGVSLSKDSWMQVGTEADRSLLQISARLREHLLGTLAGSGISGKEYSIAGALLLGSRSGLDRDTRQAFAISGAMHILAVSGLHVGILYIFLSWIMGSVKGMRHFPVAGSLIILLIIWLYALVTGLSPSVTRASTMFSFLVLAKAMRRPSNIYNTLACSALIQLIANPFTLFMVGFQLSYLAVTGIAYYQPLIYSLIRFRTFLADKFWALATVSFSAQVFIFPLIIYYFNQFPHYFLITNIFAVPLAMIILYSGLLLFIFYYIPVISSVIAILLKNVLTFLNFLTETISNLPFSHTSGIFISMPLLLILYCIVLSVSIFIFVQERPGYFN